MRVQKWLRIASLRITESMLGHNQHCVEQFTFTAPQL